MAIDFFAIEWTKLVPYDKALIQPEAREGGVYAMYRTKNGKRTLRYIGKSKEFGKRVSSHRQQASHMMTDSELKGCFVSFGLISSFEKSRMSSIITPAQLGHIENFLMTKVDSKGNSESTKKRYTSDYPMIVINTGKVLKPLDKIMSHSPELLKLLGATTKKKPVSSSDGW